MKLFRSKSFVLILVIGAIGLSVRNIVLPLLSLGRKSPATIVEITELNQVPVESVSKNIIPKANLEGISWISDYKRDPFSSLSFQKSIKQVIEAKPAVVTEKTPVVVTPVVIDENITLNGTLALRTPMAEPDKKFAVINGEIVTEGDYFKGYQVIKIDLDSVDLKGHLLYKSVKFSGEEF